MKQDNRFIWAIAWIFTVIVAASVMQDAGMRGEATGKDSLRLPSILPSSDSPQYVPAPTGYVSAELGSGMEGVSGMVPASTDFKPPSTLIHTDDKGTLFEGTFWDKETDEDGITYYYYDINKDNEPDFMLAPDGETYSVAGGSLPGASSLSPPAPGAQSGTQTPKAPQAPLPDKEKIPIGGKTFHQAIDGDYYWKKCRSCPLLKFTGYGSGGVPEYEEVTFTYTATATTSDGKTITRQYEAMTDKEIKDDLRKKGLTNIKLSRTEDAETATPTGEFQADEKGSFVYNDKGQSFWVPEGKTAQQYAIELNGRVKITEAYQKWIKDQKLPDNVQTRELFKDNPPLSMDSKLIDEALGILSAQQKEAEKTKELIQITGPDGKTKIKAWRFPDGSVTTDETEANRINEQLTLEKYEKSAKEDAKYQGLSLLEEKDLSGLRYARDKDGELYYFDKDVDRYQMHGGGVYATWEYIGKGEDMVKILRTRDVESGKVESIEIQTGTGFVPIDEETIKQIKDPKSKHSNLKIDTSGDKNVLNFLDKDNILVARTTLSKDYSLEKGTKTNEKFRKAYFHDGEEISEKKAKELEKEAKEKNEESGVIEKKEWLDSKEDKTMENGKLKYITTYDLERHKVQFGDDKQPIYIYEATKFDVDTKELVEFTYFEGDKKITWDAETKTWSGDINELQSKAETARKQYTVRQYFEAVDFALTEFRGLGYYATLFMSDEALGKWREAVDKIFAEMYLGVEYWTSAICSSNVARDQEGVAYVDTASGLAGVAAHVEATRSDAMTTPTSTEYLYKITFYVQNGDWEYDPRALEEMKFNVYLHGDRKARLLREEKKLKKGEGFGMTKANAFVQYSSYYYDKICIEFDDVPAFWSLDDDELCNVMQVPPGEAEGVPGSSPSSQQNTTSESEFLVI